jgi:hypothetical protein
VLSSVRRTSVGRGAIDAPEARSAMTLSGTSAVNLNYGNGAFGATVQGGGKKDT